MNHLMPLMPEIRIRVGCHYDKWQSSQARYYHPERRSHRVRIFSRRFRSDCRTLNLDSCSLRNVVHRHEPAVTSRPVKVLLHDNEREFIVVDKPGSIVRSWEIFCWLTQIISCSASACFRSVLPQHACRDSQERFRL
jgi:hypothetical protein